MLNGEHYPFTRMRVVQMAIGNAIMVQDLISTTRSDGDIHDQMARAADSVVSNASEAEWAIYRKVKRKALGVAVIENHELAAQVMRLLRGADHPLHDRINHVGRMISNWIKRATPGAGDRR